MKKLAFLIVILTLTCAVSAQNTDGQKKSVKEGT